MIRAKIKTIDALLLFSSLAFLAIYCYVSISKNSMSDQPNEIRITSPDGDVDALYNHGLYIVPKGSFIPINGTPLIDNSPLFVGNNLRGLRLTWNGPHVLEVHFDAGDVSVFRSPWYPHMPLWYDELSDPNIWDKNREHIIEIRLVPSFPLAAPEWLKTKN